MRTIPIAIVVILVFATSSSVRAGNDALGNGPWDVSYEPDHPGDDNGISSADPGSGGLILDASYRPWCPTSALSSDVGACYVHRFFDDELAMRTIYPGFGEFVAIHGAWLDKNQDGLIDDRPDGLNGEIEDPVDEFDGIATSDIYGFVSPGSHAPFLTFQEPRPDEPDFKYTPGGGGTDGFYRSGGGFPLVFERGNLVESFTVQSASDVIPAPRQYPPFYRLDSSLVDVDVYAAFNPDFESLFAIILGEIDPVVSTLIDDVDRTVAYARNAGTSVDPLVGTAISQVFPPWENEARQDGNAAHEYGLDYHPFLDARIARQVYVAEPASGFSRTVQFSPQPDAGPNAHAATPGIFSFSARFGLWFDENGDDWIGDGCREREFDCDPYAHGAVSDPHDYANANEFAPKCPDQALTATISPEPDENGARFWGSSGVYVIYDANEGGSNPYNDLITDVAVRGLQRLVMEGPIPISFKCDPNAPGVLASDQQIVALEGSFGYRVIFDSDPASITFRTGSGLIVEESSWDVDILEAWAAMSV